MSENGGVASPGEYGQQQPRKRDLSATTADHHNAQQLDVTDSDPHLSADDFQLRCGYGSCRPDCLQSGNNTKGLLATLSLYTFIQGFYVNGINNVNVTALERRFDLTSTRVAWISSTYDLSAGLCCLIFGYLGLFVHNGRMLTVACGCMTVGAFIMFLPHVLAGQYELGIKTSDECDIYGNLTRCVDSSAGTDFYFLFILGMILAGIGGSAAFLLGAMWLDDNLDAKNTPVYLGIMHGVSALGPAVAFLAGGAILDSIYVDVNRDLTNVIDMNPEDPRWVGAWWIGFLISAFVSAIVVFMLACFPRVFPDTIRANRVRSSQAYRGQGIEETSRAGFGRSWKDIGTSIKIVCTNPPWMCVTVAGILENGSVFAFVTFLPKLLQFQFGVTPGMSSIIAGAAVVPGAAIGQVLGGLVAKWAKLRARGLLLQCAICSVVAGSFSAVLLIRCDMPVIAGITQAYTNSTLLGSQQYLESSCNSHCNCTRRSYEPICGYNDVEYFSPCHGGCLEMATEELTGDTLYNTCSCINDIVPNNVTFGREHGVNNNTYQAREGFCDIDCNKIFIFMPLFLVVVIATFMSNTAGHSVVIRCVPDGNRSFAYGIQYSIVRLLGSVPGPVIFGYIFDGACLVWRDDCGSRGSCWIYDNAALSWGLFLVAIIVNVVSGFLFFLAAGIYRFPEQIQDKQSTKDTNHVVSADEISTGISEDNLGYTNKSIESTDL